MRQGHRWNITSVAVPPSKTFYREARLISIETFGNTAPFVPAIRFAAPFDVVPTRFDQRIIG
jgi:hypothetical protein